MTEMVCAIKGCPKEYRARGWCHSHYRKFMKWGDPLHDGMSLEHKLAKYFRPEGEGCWEWRGGRSRAGYGVFSVDRIQVKAHRFIYELLVGPIPSGLVIDHLCSNPPCVRPDHLEAVTTAENVQRTWDRGRQPPRKPRKHKVS